MVNEISRRGFLNQLLAGTALAAAGGLVSIASADHIIGSKKIISIEDYGSKFATVKYEDEKGQLKKENVFHGHKLRHGDVVVDLHDYIRSFGGSMPYGPFNVEQYREYQKSRKK